MKTTQQRLEKERADFKQKLKIHCKINRIQHQSIYNQLELSAAEFTNMLTGFQASVPSKNILSFDEFKERVFGVLGITEF